jgi:hypothetical protein
MCALHQRLDTMRASVLLGLYYYAGISVLTQKAPLSPRLQELDPKATHAHITHGCVEGAALRTILAMI